MTDKKLKELLADVPDDVVVLVEGTAERLCSPQFFRWGRGSFKTFEYDGDTYDRGWGFDEEYVNEDLYWEGDEYVGSPDSDSIIEAVVLD